MATKNKPGMQHEVYGYHADNGWIDTEKAFKTPQEARVWGRENIKHSEGYTSFRVIDNTEAVVPKEYNVHPDPVLN